MTHTSTAFHKLDLFLVNFHDTAIRIVQSLISNYKTVGKGGNLIFVPNSGHRASLWNDVFKVFQQTQNLTFRHGIWIFKFYPPNFPGNSKMHIQGSSLIKISKESFKAYLLIQTRAASSSPLK